METKINSSIWLFVEIYCFLFLGSYIHTVAQFDSTSSSSSQKPSQIQGTGFMAGVVIGAIAGAFVLSALVSRCSFQF